MNNDGKYYLGIDIGSTTFKAVLLTDDGKVGDVTYQRTKPVESGKVTCRSNCSQCGNCNLGALKKTVDTFLAGAGLTQKDICCTIVTGSQIVEDTAELKGQVIKLQRRFGAPYRKFLLIFAREI